MINIFSRQIGKKKTNVDWWLVRAAVTSFLSQHSMYHAILRPINSGHLRFTYVTRIRYQFKHRRCANKFTQPFESHPISQHRNLLSAYFNASVNLSATIPHIHIYYSHTRVKCVKISLQNAYKIRADKYFCSCSSI